MAVKLTIGEQIRIAFQRSGYSYQDVKEHTGLQSATTNKVLNSAGSMGSVLALCDFLGVELDLNFDNLKHKEDEYKKD